MLRYSVFISTNILHKLKSYHNGFRITEWSNNRHTYGGMLSFIKFFIKINGMTSPDFITMNKKLLIVGKRDTI